jgi:hypothetical protein
MPWCDACHRWSRDGDAPKRNSTRDRKQEKIEQLEAELRRLSNELHARTNGEINFQGLIDFQASRLFLHFGMVNVKSSAAGSGIVNKGTRNQPVMPTQSHALYPILEAEQSVFINYTGKIDFSVKVHEGEKIVTTRWSHDCLQEPRGCVDAPTSAAGVRKRPKFDTRFEPFLSMKKPTNDYEAHQANFTLASVVKDCYLGARGTIKSTIKVKSAVYKLFGELTEEEVDGEGLPNVDSVGNTMTFVQKKTLLRRVLSLFQGTCHPRTYCSGKHASFFVGVIH